jgi:hypothetical protein
MKGNSCSGAADAAPEKAATPIANAAKTPARQECGLKAPILNMDRPCLMAPRALWGVVKKHR